MRTSAVYVAILKIKQGDFGGKLCFSTVLLDIFVHYFNMDKMVRVSRITLCNY